MKLEVGHTDLNELIENVQTGRVSLPEFQRDFVWKPTDVVDLLCSVARKWPIGSFLIMETLEPPFAVRPLEDAPQLSDEASLIVLDGQQRCTSLYHAFTDNSPGAVFYLQFPEDWSEFEDEQVKFEKKERFARHYPNLKKMANDRVIKISDIHDDERFEAWKEFLPDADARKAAVSFRSNQVGGFKAVQVPHTKLSGDPDLLAVAKIFETINRTGKRLDTFDLMVARLFPYDFKLRDEWDAARDANPVLIDFDVHGLEIMKLIALKKWDADVSAGGSAAALVDGGYGLVMLPDRCDRRRGPVRTRRG